MNKFLMTAAAATAVFAMAPSANAADITHAYDIGTPTPNFFVTSGNIASGPVTAFVGDVFTGLGLNSVATFETTYTFIIDQVGLGAGTVINIGTGSLDDAHVEFSAITFNNGVSTFGGATAVALDKLSATLNAVPVYFGLQNTITITGTVYGPTSQGNAAATTATYGGTASFVPLPEPATWAMMLVGFGLVGFALRRRQSVKTTVSYAA